MKTKFVAAALIVVALGLAMRASAWDDTGHIQVADSAWTQLNSRAKQQIAAILAKGDSRFRPHGNSEAAVRDAFRRAATFPDVIKSNRNTIYESMIPQMNRLFFVSAPPDPSDA